MAPMEINLNQVLQFLRENKYILASKEKGYVLSKTFQQDVARLKANGEDIMVSQKGYKDVMPSSQNTGVIVAPPIHTIAKMHSTGVDWIEWFTRFIKEAQVPQRLENNRLEQYAVNKYSEDGMKAFKKAMEGNYEYGLLVKSTMLYYKSTVRFKKAIGNYMKDGDWRTDYENLKSAALEGTKELQEHIKQEVKSNEHNTYRLG